MSNGFRPRPNGTPSSIQGGGTRVKAGNQPNPIDAIDSSKDKPQGVDQ